MASADPKNSLTVLALQGGGALGAYQAGVFQALTEQGIRFDWVIGTSIGAINGAIIAGNPPERRLARLQEFWHRLAQEEPAIFPFAGAAAWMGPLLASAAMAGIFVNGIPGFFTPRKGLSWDPNTKVPPTEASFYDTSPLAATLQHLVDFDYLNSAAVRYTIGAVKVSGGELEWFDNTRPPWRGKFTPHHVMASGALPPGFPPVKIEGEAYWDGGVYSNTPLDVVLEEDEHHDLLCFSIDLWAPDTRLPTSIAEVLNQEKNIRYASRSREHLHDHRLVLNLQRAVRLLGDKLTEAQRRSEEVQRLLALGRSSRINIVRLIMQELPQDNYLKDVDFRRATLDTRWKAGYENAQEAARHKSWLQPLPPDVALCIHHPPG
jgi:NTE family protein